MNKLYQTTIQSINGTTATDIQGKTYYLAGNNPLVAGQQVFTDGKIIYGNTFTGSQPYIPASNGGILWLIPYKEIQLIDKSLTKIKTLCNTDASFITYDMKNFNAYIGGHWQKLPAIKDYKVLDACYNKDGDLLEIGYITDTPNYSKGYKGKTEALKVYDESSYVESGPIQTDYAKRTDWYEYQAFYDFTDQTTGSPDFIKIVKNGEIEKSINTQNFINSLDNDLQSHALTNMGVQNMYKMYESVSLGKDQMTRNKDGGYTFLLTVSCTYIAYCVKYRDFKEPQYTDENDQQISGDSHHFGKILASQQILVTEKGTKIINKSYTISGVGKSWGNLYRKSLGDSEDWPCYYTIQVEGYGGDMQNAKEPQPPKGLSLWYTWKYNQYWKSWDYQNQEWIITNTPGGFSKAVRENKNFTDYAFFAPQFKNEKLDQYTWRLDNGVILFNEKDYKLSANGCSFDYWSNIIFSAYPFKKGFLFVVFYMRENKIKLIYWDGSEQKEVASCPYVGVYNRAFRVCEFKNMAKVKNMAGA